MTKKLIIRNLNIVCNRGIEVLASDRAIEAGFVQREIPVGLIPKELDSEMSLWSRNHSQLKRTDRMVKMSAWLASKLDNSELAGRKVLVNLGSSRGGTQLTEDLHQQFLETGSVPIIASPLTTQANMSSVVASVLDAESIITIDHSLTCSTGIASVANAIAWLRSGMADVVVCGAAEAAVTPFTIAQIEALGIASRYKVDEFPCRPFNVENENTFVLSEGAGICVILIDFPKAGDLVIESIGFAHQLPPSATGIAEDGGPLLTSMREAVENLPVNRKVDLVLAHAPGTVKGDRAESNAINSVLGSQVSVYSPKWLTGHTYAASSMLNLKLAAELFSGAIPPKLPYESYLKANLVEPKTILINATGFGGNAMSLVVSGDVF
jgi:3-oxoacyl-(acyl-carrier-protein) synthase